MKLLDPIRSILDPRPTATARGFRADRVGRSRTFHYRPTYPTGRPLTPGHAAALLMTDAVHGLTDDQLEAVGHTLDLTATGQRADQDRDRDQVTATGGPSATDRATVSRSTATDRQGRGAA